MPAFLFAEASPSLEHRLLTETRIKCPNSINFLFQTFDDIIFVFFSLEMSIKMVAMGMYGKNTYLADSWNRLDFFIVLSGALEYCLHMENLNLTAIRTIRVLRPLRAINRIPSKYKIE